MKVHKEWCTIGLFTPFQPPKRLKNSASAKKPHPGNEAYNVAMLTLPSLVWIVSGVPPLFSRPRILCPPPEL